MKAQIRKINQYFKMLKENMYYSYENIENIGICDCDYKEGHTPPSDGFVPFESGALWGNGYDSHAWFHFTLDLPKTDGEDPTLLFVDTGDGNFDQIQTSSKRWDAVNPQFIVYINGELLEEPYVTEKGLGDCDLEFPYKVPGTSYFVLGDQRSNSVDSRNSAIGSISEDDIIGRVFVRVWPFARFGFIY